LARRIGKRGKTISLSGTLVPNRPIELWPLMYATRMTSMKYEDFAYRYANAFVDDWGDLDVTGSSNEDELRAILAPHAIRFLKEDVLSNLPTKTFRVYAMDLPIGEQEKQYSIKDLRRSRDPVALEAMSVILREHGERKLPLVVDHCKEAMEEEDKIVVFAHHRDLIEQLKQKLCLGKPVVLQGGMTDAEKDRAVQRFRTDPECKVFIGQIQAAGVGIDGLQDVCSRVIFAEGSWVPSDIQQASDRCHRHGQTSNVLVDLLTVHGSIDEHMLRRTLEKQRVVDQVVPTDPWEVPF
jgi:SNF2 family DNA or RNA helicase